MYFSFACPKEKVPKEKDSLSFRRPTNGSIPKPVKPFVQRSWNGIVSHAIELDSLLRLAFNGIFAEWVPRLKP